MPAPTANLPIVGGTVSAEARDTALNAALATNHDNIEAHKAAASNAHAVGAIAGLPAALATKADAEATTAALEAINSRLGSLIFHPADIDPLAAWVVLGGAFQDVEGNTPAVTDGDPVRLLCDAYDERIVPRANLIRNSADLSHGQYTVGGLSAQVVPDGERASGGAILTAAGGGAVKFFNVPLERSPGWSIPVTFEIDVKAGTHDIVQISRSGSGDVYANFDLSTGTIGDNDALDVGIRSVGDGWWRVHITSIWSSGDRAFGVYFQTALDRGNKESTGSTGTVLIRRPHAAIGGDGAPFEATSGRLRANMVLPPALTSEPPVIRFHEERIAVSPEGNDSFLFAPFVDLGSRRRLWLSAGLRKLSDAATAYIFTQPEFAPTSGNNGAWALSQSSSTGDPARRVWQIGYRTGGASNRVDAQLFAAPITSVVTGLWDNHGANAAAQMQMRVDGEANSVVVQDEAESGAATGFRDGIFVFGKRAANEASTVSNFSGLLFGAVLKAGTHDLAEIERVEEYLSSLSRPPADASGAGLTVVRQQVGGVWPPRTSVGVVQWVGWSEPPVDMDYPYDTWVQIPEVL